MTDRNPERDALIAENRARYEALRTAGQGETTRSLPPATPLDGAPLTAAAVIHREEVPAGWYWTTALRRGEALRLVNLTGGSSVSLVAWREADPSERINTADTVKVQWRATLGKGRMILSDMGRAMLSLIEDTSGLHDLLVGGSTAASAAGGRNTRDNLVGAAGKLGLDRRDIPAAVTFFAPVTVRQDGRFDWRDDLRRAGDFVDLRAEMDLLVALSNCPHPLDPAPHPGPVAATRFRAPPPAPDDICRTIGPEARRAYAATDRLHA